MNKRITIEMTSEAYERVQLIMDKVNATDHAELIRSAFRLYEWAVDEREKGGGIGAIDPAGTLTLVDL